MERVTPARKTHASTADLLTWSEVPQPDSDSSAAVGNSSRSTTRPPQGNDGISKVLFGGEITVEEAESLNKRKPCSGYKLKEMTGSKIFSTESDDGASDESGNGHISSNNRTSVRIVQQAANGISQISFSTEERISPKKPTSLTEVAKQRELSGTLESEADDKIKKQLSDAKCKELSGNDIFGPPAEVPPRSLAAARSMELKDEIHEEDEEPTDKTESYDERRDGDRSEEEVGTSKAVLASKSRAAPASCSRGRKKK